MQLYPSTDLKMGSGSIGAAAIGTQHPRLALPPLACFSMLGRLFYPAFTLQLRLHFSLDSPTTQQSHELTPMSSGLYTVVESHGMSDVKRVGLMSE